MATDKDQRTIDREAELARQKEVTDALAKHEAASVKEAQKRLDQGDAYVDEAEETRLRETREALNASVKASDKLLKGTKV